MFKRRNLVMFSILIILLSIIIYINLYSYQSTSSNSNLVKEIKLMTHLNKYTDSEYSINVLRVNNNIVYGTIETNKDNHFLFTTVGIFSYDIATDELTFKNFLPNQRIINFITIDSNLYYCILSSEENSTFKWELYLDNWNAFDINKNMLLDSGYIKNLLDYPRMIYLEKDSAVISFKKQEDDKIEHKICKVDSKGNIKELISDNGYLHKNEGILLYNDDNLLSTNYKIYYTILNSDNSQSLISFDLNSLTQDTLFTNKDEEMAISSFIISNNYIFLQLTDKENDLNSTNIILNKEREQVYSFNSQMFTFANLIDHDTILFHNSGDIWQLFACEDFTLQNIDLNINSIFPKYFVLSKNQILIQTFEKQFYSVNLEI